jgi:HEPN domain-containing protein
MLLRTDLQSLARLRLQEAEALHNAGLYDGCVYLCGYVLEMALKACVCKTLKLAEYPDTDSSLRDFKTHEFRTLLLLAGLRAEFAEARLSSPSFDFKCNLVLGWKPDLRYQTARTSEADSLEQLNALRSDPDGVLLWLQNRW